MHVARVASAVDVVWDDVRGGELPLDEVREAREEENY